MSANPSAPPTGSVDAPLVHPRTAAVVCGSEADIKRRTDVLRRLEVPVVGVLESQMTAARMANSHEANCFLPGTTTLNVRAKDWLFVLWNDLSVPDFLKSRSADILRPAGSDSSELVHAEMKDIILARSIQVSYDPSEWENLRTSVLECNYQARMTNMKRITKSRDIEARTQEINAKRIEEKKEMDVDDWIRQKLDAANGMDLYVVQVEFWRRKENVTAADVTITNFWGPFEPETLLKNAGSINNWTIMQGLVSIVNVFCIVPFRANPGPYKQTTNSITFPPAMKKLLCYLPSRGGYFPSNDNVVASAEAVSGSIADTSSDSSPASSSSSDSDADSKSSSSSASDSDDRVIYSSRKSIPPSRRVKVAKQKTTSSSTIVSGSVPASSLIVPARRRKVPLRTGPNQPISAPVMDEIHRLEPSGRQTAADIIQSYTDALSSVSPAPESESRQRNLPGSSIAAHRQRRQESSRTGAVVRIPPSTTDKKSFVTPRTTVRVPKGYSAAGTVLISPPEFDQKMSRANGTYVVVIPTDEEIKEFGDRFWVGKLLADGPERGEFTVKWMKSYYSRKVEGREPEFGTYRIWTNKREVISTKDVKYAFGKLSKKGKLMKRDEDALRVLIA